MAFTKYTDEHSRGVFYLLHCTLCFVDTVYLAQFLTPLQDTVDNGTLDQTVLMGHVKYALFVGR